MIARERQHAVGCCLAGCSHDVLGGIVPNRAPLAIAILATLALTACGGEPTDSTEPTNAAPTAEPTEESSEPVSDTCKDTKGDGRPVDLKSIKVTRDEVGLTVVVKVIGPLPRTDTAMVGINVSSGDGEMSRQLAVKWVDGNAPGPFIFDMGSAEQENLPASAFKVDGRTIAIDFPAESVSDLGEGWEWSAFSNAAGDDVDACPGEVLSFKKRTFPSE